MTFYDLKIHLAFSLFLRDLREGFKILFSLAPRIFGKDFFVQEGHYLTFDEQSLLLYLFRIAFASLLDDCLFI